MFLHPLGLLALLAVPSVLALHLFRRRFRPHRVSALFLWMDDDEHPAAGRKRERLRKNASFWLEILIALLLGLAFAGPKGCSESQAEHLVCVLDSSASMGAQTRDLEGQPVSLREATLEVLGAHIAALSPRSLVTLIESAARPRILAGPAAFPAEALAALAAYRPSAGRHALDSALALALQVSGGGRVLVISDHFEPERFPSEVQLVSIGQPTDNVAITHAARGRGADQGDRILVSLSAFSARAVDVDLVISAEGAELRRERVRLEPDQRRHFAFQVPRATPGVEVRLSPDALAIDDAAYLAPLPRRSLGLASTLSIEEGLALGLASGNDPEQRLGRLLELIPDAHLVAPEAAHLLIVGSVATQPGARAWSLSIEGPLGGSSAPADLIGPFLFERGHELLRGLTLSGVVWSMAPELELPGTTLVAAGDQAILSERRGAQRRSYHFNLNPFRSSLQRSPDWPILLSNLAELRRAELPGALRSNLSVGETLLYQSQDPGNYHLSRIGGGVERDAEALDTLQIEDLGLPGFYRLSAATGELATYGLSFKDPAESDLRRMRPGVHDPMAALAEARAMLGPLETLLLALALLALIADWWVLKRMQRDNKLVGIE